MPLFNYQILPAFPATGGATSATPKTLALRGFKDLAYDFLIDDLVTPLRLVEGADAVVQNMIIRFQCVLGEWFLDQRQGVPYRERVFVVNPDVRALRSLFTKVAESTPGVASVGTLDLEVDKRTRTLRCKRFSATLSDGSNVVFDPFIIDSPKVPTT